ncbi:MAG TPA: cobyric acid synthase [Oligoflexus sp.]|uniref:cobyric acid synthase n=1 Tax=Oligoflexus sp. TaxID=1971216 RepID=UPI002D35F76B|nr:cobyric acid synthase [Oligoflexus sp.]HYX39050.1 cobyric acid synthase [Oligoflexus sp.]
MSNLSPVLMVQGTSSNVGKSLIATALCRWFAQRGFKVAPFKAQNMALNAGVTRDGGEIGRAQMIQAEAAGVEATVHMNPLLLKPEGDRHSQLVILGRPAGRYHFGSYHEQKPRLREIILNSLEELRRTHDIVIVEGAGSPAEVNLKANDIVNMFVAKSVKAPVLLVGDIDRGGVFASLLGTLDLLDPDERELVAGFVINKFRGDPALFVDGIHFIEERSGKPVFGVLPYMRHHGVAEEDSLGLDSRPDRLRRDPDGIDIAVIRLPRLSNYDEFAKLEEEKNCHVAYITDPREAHDADLLIIPGSKATISDLQWLRERGFADVLQQRLAARRPVLAICGGYQMMGLGIHDPDQVEAHVSSTPGLGLLPIQTHFTSEKVTRQRQLQFRKAPDWMPGMNGTPLQGYEIHMGRVTFPASAISGEAAMQDADDGACEGWLHKDGQFLGTLIHGLFDNTHLRLATINALRRSKGLAPVRVTQARPKSMAFDALADNWDQHINMAAILKLLQLPARKTHAIPYQHT